MSFMLGQGRDGCVPISFRNHIHIYDGKDNNGIYKHVFQEQNFRVTEPRFKGSGGWLEHLLE